MGQGAGRGAFHRRPLDERDRRSLRPISVRARRLEQLRNQVVPQLEESAALVRRGYQVGAVQLTFADVLLAEQSLNDARLRLAETRRELALAVADLKGLMQLDIGENP